jgi:PST family polysaccharide transporter
MSTRLAQVLLQFVTIIVLARFLTPSDFGLYGMVTPLVAFFLVLRDAGLGMATLQSAVLSERQASTLFYTNVLVGFALSALFVSSASLVAGFYGETRLVDIVRALCIMFLFSGVRVQLEALVFRGYRFQSVFIMEIIASSLAFLISTGVALKGYGYWALCARQLTYEITYTSALFIYVRWIPRSFRMDRETFSLFKFGVNAVLSNFVVYFLRNVDNVLIGWKFGAAVLGPYSLGYRTVLLPIQQVVTPLSRVFIPHLSQQQHDPVGFAKSYALALRAMMFFVAPPLCAAWICASEAINILLGSQWHEAVPIIQWLVPAGILQVAYLSAGWINFSRGRADRQLWWGVLSLPIVVGGFVIGLQWGGVGVAASYSITNGMLLIPLFVYAVRGTAITLGNIVRAVMPAAFASVSVIALGYWARYTAIDRGLSDVLVLVIVAAIAAVTMLAFGPAIFGWSNLYRIAGNIRARFIRAERPLRGDGLL